MKHKILQAISLTIKQNKRLFARFFSSLFVSVLILAIGFTVYSAAESPLGVGNVSNDSQIAVEQANPDADVIDDTDSALYDLIGIDASQPLEIVLLITVLSVAPSILLMMTSFTRIVIVFSFLRNAMQTQTIPPNQIMTSLALFLTVFIMWPVFSEINDVAYQPYERGELSTWEAVEAAGGPLKNFMLRQTTKKSAAFFLELANRTIYQTNTLDTENEVAVDLETSETSLDEFSEQLGFEIVIPAFMISELSRAFQMGFLLFIPFLIIDIVVSSILMSMGMMMLPPAMISMPFKIMLFVLVDGWQLLIGSVIKSFL